jgi:type III restriction enzyme
MKLKFKHQTYQTEAVQAVVDCFKGQQPVAMQTYRIDPGKQAVKKGHIDYKDEPESGFRNSEIVIPESTILEKILGFNKRIH